MLNSIMKLVIYVPFSQSLEDNDPISTSTARFPFQSISFFRDIPQLSLGAHLGWVHLH